MRVLIVASGSGMGKIWARHLERSGIQVFLSMDQEAAIVTLCDHEVDVIVVNMTSAGSGTMAVVDFAAYRQPAAKVVFVSNGQFFSDGSVFQHFFNACAVVSETVSVDDLGAVVQYHGAA